MVRLGIIDMAIHNSEEEKTLVNWMIQFATQLDQTWNKRATLR